ncbi:hypothetical protein [Streptomyces sp. HUAS TT7]|uniref:hypothetical protein n=1 Tax=Streptomyces sp. HUAS TT7 TaxID=3447507 RepID=UPI003F655F0E
MRSSRNVDTPTAGALAYRRSGIAFLVSCAPISLSTGIPAWASATLLPAAVVVHTIGELWHAAAGFEVSATSRTSRRHPRRPPGSSRPRPEE